MKKIIAPAVLVLTVAACSGGTAGTSSSAAVDVLAADPWVRTTDGAQDLTMTALFVNLTNPTTADIKIIGAECGDVAKMVQIHEMVEVEGTMVMQEAAGGVVVPAGSHLHMAPGGPHVMLMNLTRELPAGSEEITCSLAFDNGRSVSVTAPVKEFTGEQETYHTHAAASPSASGSMEG